MSYPAIKPGKRAIIAGRTGSGKSTLGCWLLNRSPGHWLILNPKHTSAYNDLNNSNIVRGIDLDEIDASLSEFKFTILNPESSKCEPEYMDALIMWLHESYSSVGLCVDELYSLHKGGRAGQGLIGWLTRGRELKQSFIGLTQRPAWLSQFLFSESDYISGMSLGLEQDRKKMFENTGSAEFLEKLPPHYWLWFDVAGDRLRKFGPVPVI